MLGCNQLLKNLPNLTVSWWRESLSVDRQSLDFGECSVQVNSQDKHHKQCQAC